MHVLPDSVILCDISNSLILKVPLVFAMQCLSSTHLCTGVVEGN